jgi:hypothetical protein
MIQALEETFPSDVAMNILKFCRHPCAEIIKGAYIYDPELSYYYIKKGGEERKYYVPPNIYEEYWNDLIDHIKACREGEREIEEEVHMGRNDYDATTGRPSISREEDFMWSNDYDATAGRQYKLNDPAWFYNKMKKYYEESDEDRYLFKKNDKRKTLEKKRNRKNKVLSFEEE